MGDVFDMSTPDAKVLDMIAILNEIRIGDRELNLIKELIKARPKYYKGIVALRFLNYSTSQLGGLGIIL